MKNLKGFEEIGFTVDHAHQCAYGTIEGYQFVVNFLPQQRQYTLMSTVKTENEVGAMTQYLDSMDKGNFINWTIYKDNAVIVNLKNHKELDVYAMQKIMQDIAMVAAQNGYVQCCRHCGEETVIHPVSVNGNTDLACERCLAEFTSQQPPIKEVNLPLGIVGALVGSVIGVAVWILIYQLGFVAGITGFIMAVCCFKGYEMLGGRIDKKGVWIAIVIAVVMLAVAEMLCLGIEIHSLYSEYYDISFFDAMSVLPTFLGESEIVSAVLGDLAFGYVFMAVASFSYIKNIQKRVNTEGVIERLG